MMLFAWGAGNHGQLFNGLDDSSVPVVVDRKSEFEKLVGGGSHSMLIANGTLLAAGSNDEGQLGFDNLPGANTDYPALQPVFNPDQGVVTAVGCGWSHTLVLMDAVDGHKRLFGFGSNVFAQLALSVAQTSVPTPIPLPFSSKIAHVSCGMRHSALIEEDGSLWLFGENRFGQCAVESLEPVATPTRCEALEEVVSVALGARHTIALTDNGAIFGFGENRFGQIGQNPASIAPLQRSLPNGKSKTVRDIIISPIRLDMPQKTTKRTILRAGWNFSLFWTPPGPDSDIDTVVTLGRNNYGQLGNGTATAFEWAPQILDLNLFGGSIQQIECGSEHTLVLDARHQVWSFGWNEHGQLGLGDEKDRFSPTLVSSLSVHEIRSIACGYGFSFALANNRVEVVQ